LFRGNQKQDGAASAAAESAAPYTESSKRRRLVAPSDHLCAITDVGRIREHNEDAFYISSDGRILVVADGMGGHAAGEVASVLAVESIAEFFRGERRQAIDGDSESVESLLREALETAHRTVCDASREREERCGMGTTLLVAYINGDTLHTCHVGDVRCYVLAASALEQITRDHSVVNLLVERGEISREAARDHPRKNEILQAVGSSDGIIPEVNSRPLKQGDCVLLCSDGLWEAASDAEISEILAWEGSMRQRATQLVDRANYGGGRDNITVVLYEHIGEGFQAGDGGEPVQTEAACRSAP
jgi:serine/threonine protein phosphatase PrpC